MSNTSRKTRKRRTVRMSADEVKKRVKRTPAQLAELRERAKGPIDTSDIPELTDEAAEAARIVRPRPKVAKVQVTMRLDEDIVQVFRSEGSGYQTRINDALREYLAVVRATKDDTDAMVDQIEALLERLRDRVA